MLRGINSPLGFGIILRRPLLLLAVICAVVPGFSAAKASADVVTLHDGRFFEGRIMSRDENAVVIDTLVAGIRATLSINRSDVQTLVEKPLRDGFFDPPPAPAMAARPTLEQTDEALYLEVPLLESTSRGAVEEGVRITIAYARRNKINHIVFDIDGQSMPELEETSAVFDMLNSAHEGIGYHAVVRHCVGEAMALGVACDTISIVPNDDAISATDQPVRRAGSSSGARGTVQRSPTSGRQANARAGGGPGSTPSHKRVVDSATKAALEKEETYRRELKYELASHLMDHGLIGWVAARQLDPASEFSVWRDADKALQYGVHAPPKTPQEQILMHVLPGEALRLTEAEFIALGLPEFDGGLKELGAQLKFPNWKLESDFGANAVAQATEQLRAKAATVQAAFEEQVHANVQRRKILNRILRHGVSQAAKWDPSKASYGVYSTKWHWYEAKDGYSLMTAESQQRWQDRTDKAMSYLKHAGDAAVELKALDRAAVQLGLEPTYKAGELDLIITDLQNKYTSLEAERKKQYK